MNEKEQNDLIPRHFGVVLFGASIAVLSVGVLRIRTSHHRLPVQG